MLDDVNIFMINASEAQTVKIFFPARGIIAMDRMGHLIEVEPHKHGTNAEAMIAMKMADKNAGHHGRRDLGKNKLPLRALSRIEKQTLFIPTKKIGPMIAISGGLLAGAS